MKRNMIISSDYLRETKKRAIHKRYMSIVLAGGGLLVVGLYFTYQLRDWILLPRLSLEQPADGALLMGPKIMVEGTATPGIRLTVNGIAAYNEEHGRFRAELLLPAGLHTIRVVAENRFRRVRSIERQIVIEEMGSIQQSTSTEGEIYQ